MDQEVSPRDDDRNQNRRDKKGNKKVGANRNNDEDEAEPPKAVLPKPNHDAENDSRPPCPLLDKSPMYCNCLRWISRNILFGWAYPLLALGMERPLDEPDLPALHPDDTSKGNRNRIETLWRNCRHKSREDNSRLAVDWAPTPCGQGILVQPTRVSG